MRYEIVLCRQQNQELTLDALAARAGLHPALVQRFVDVGLLVPTARVAGTLFFAASAVPRLRMIGRLRQSLGINLAGIAVILDLRDRLYALQRENERQRLRL
jgi:DNA-binding transcriptional MerR regulator